MKLVIGKEPLRQILRWIQGALFACAVFLLAYCGFAWVDSWVFQRRESVALDRQLQDQRMASEGTARFESSAPRPGTPPAAAERLIGRIEIPRLSLSAVVVDGIDETTLRRAVGHIPGTALPGQSGNVGLAGHRDTFFRALRDLKIKDEVQFSTLKGEFRYEVESLIVVQSDYVEALAPSSENVLTLVTCYPFSYIGTAPKRFIVKAKQVSPQLLPPSTVE